jgi:predicted house-cleaning noncanonical NTP pyrophosphatase (MazG superfamily)
MKYNKLVRDKIPEYIKSKGGNPITHIAKKKEYWEKLKEKLLEEIKEFCESESIEEMADIQEVVNAICNYKKFNKKKIESIRKKKAKERGAFKKKIILEES